MSAAEHEAKARIEGVRRCLDGERWGVETKAGRPVMFPERLSPVFLSEFKAQEHEGVHAAAYMAAPV